MNGDVLFQNAQSCLTMAVGSDRQPVESPIVPVCGKPRSNSLTRLHGVRNHIPYSDHNYGKPLTPPDSCSPDHQEEADTGNEDEGFTRCICGFKHDDGYMICCDRCSAWQHVECVGINCVPETYLCDVCDPRPLDKKRAIQIQTKKIEEPTDEEDEEDGDVSGHDSDNASSRLSLPNSAMKEIVLSKGKRKKRESNRKLNQKEMKHNKRKRRKRKHISSSDTIPVDEETNGPWNIISPFPEHKQYEEAQKTVYIGDLENGSFPSLELNANPSSILRPEQICKVVDVQKNKKGVVVTEDINGQEFIIECKGALMLESKYKEDHPMFSKCDPFVLYYKKLELVMNFSLYGNDARFIRRSCSPTAEVRHVTIDDKPRLVVVSMTPLAKGTEVTLRFEFPFQEYRRQLECACAQDNCTVLKHNEAIKRVEQTNGYRSSKDEHGLVESSLSNHMDSDSDGESNTKDKRSRKKLSREDRKLQQYLRQFEKMEKTEKKKQQHSNGRDARTGVLTQRNYPEEYNGETPSKLNKGLSRKQGLLSQRQQRKIQAVRRGQRLTSCSSEPLSPEDNYSSAASTPTTPCVNVIEESNEQHHHETPEKSFKFPKFKKGSLNDVTVSNLEASQSNNPSPEATGYSSPSKPSFESRLVEVDEPSCDRLLHATMNGGGSSPRTDPNCSPSPCHSTYASPTHSESVDLADDMFTRHHLASPTGSSVASYILNSGLYRSSPTHTTLKKRWLLQYANDRLVNKPPPNGINTGNVLRPGQNGRSAVFPRTFPLPYKRRKLMEYQKIVNNSTSQPILDKPSQADTSITLAESATAVSSPVQTSTMTSTSPAVMSSSMTSVVMSSSMTSVVMSSSMMSPSAMVTSSAVILPVISSVTSTTVAASENNINSSSAIDVRLTMLPTLRTTTSGGAVTGSEDTFPRVTGSEEASWQRRISGGSEDTSGNRSSVSSISSTDDVKMDVTATGSHSPKNEQNLANAVGSSSEATRKPPASQAIQENSLESSTDCVTREDASRDKTGHVGSSGVVEGSGAASTTQTTPGGKKKVSLTEYLSRKRTTGSAGKKEAPVPSSDVSSAGQSRVSEPGNVLPSSSEPSSVLSYRGSLGTSVTKSGYGGTLLSTSSVSSSTSGVMIEPVSPDEGYRGDNDRSLLHSTVHGLKSSSSVEHEAKSPFRSYSQHLPARPVSEPGSNSDAMDIDDEDDAPSSSTILVVNTTDMTRPSARSVMVSSSDMMTSLPGKPYSNIGQSIKYNNVTSAQPLPGRQVTNPVVLLQNPGRLPVPVSQIPNTTVQPQPRYPEFRPAGSRPSPFH